jgi:hypothetical protein
MKNHLDLLIRSHELYDKGWNLKHNNRCLTIFSAPHYCGKNDNHGVILKLHTMDFSYQNIVRSIIRISPIHYPTISRPRYSLFF